MKLPRSPYDKVGGLVYFARMLDKMRLHAANELPSDYHDYLGKGIDMRITSHLQISYPRLKERVLHEGGSDEEILDWCYQNGRRLGDIDITIWNGFITKFGLRDEFTPKLEEFKAASGLAGRTDIDTFFHYYDVDEKRAL